MEEMGEIMTILTVVVLTFIVATIWLKLKNRNKQHKNKE